jgi:hypothetical protein
MIEMEASLSNNTKNLLLVCLIVFFIGSFILTFFTIFSITAKQDKAGDMINAMTSVLIIDIILVASFTGVAIAYIGIVSEKSQPYMLFLLHMNLLLSILSISISSLYGA